MPEQSSYPPYCELVPTGLRLSVTANLGLLRISKYTNFFLASLEQSLRLAGTSCSFPLLSVILPIGVSFYTFEAINYVVDVCSAA